MHDQTYGSAPSETSFEVFVGLWVLVVALIGIAAGFLSALAGIVMMALDAFGVLFTFAGGVVRSPQFFLHFLPTSLSSHAFYMSSKEADGPHKAFESRPKSSN